MLKFNVLQLCLVSDALSTAKDEERESLLALQSELQELIQLTEESLDTVSTPETADPCNVEGKKEEEKELDDEYALFMVSSHLKAICNL